MTHNWGALPFPTKIIVYVVMIVPEDAFYKSVRLSLKCGNFFDVNVQINIAEQQVNMAG